MNRLTRALLHFTALSSFFCPVTAIAQAESAPILTPRIGGQFSTGPGAGYNSSFGSFYGWIPFLQTPGSHVGFAETRLNIATEDGRLGGNILLGYRGAFEESDWVWGTYLGYDLRSNGRHTFQQVGAGADLQGAGWEARLNAYFPIGNTEATVAQNETLLSSTASDGRFVGNYLQFTRSQTVRRDRVTDAALTGADLEIGGKLAAWEGGDLRGYVGGYLYSGENVSTFAGFRSRIVARPTANTNIGLSVQRDREFGTNLILSLGVNWGGNSPNSPELESSIAARLGEDIERQHNIVLARRTTSNTTSTISTTNALNPATGQPWFFRHVSANSNGNGTIENPYSSIETALNGIPSDGNQIVYVQGNGSFGGNLTVASNVQLLSAGPIQQIPTAAGNLQLPLSGSGDFPTLTSPVILGNNSLIDGFNLDRALTIDNLNGTAIARNLNINITAPNESGLSCSNISSAATLNLSNVNLLVNNSTSYGIRCTNVSGSVAINSGNLTVNNSKAAISLENNPGSVNLSGLTATANNSILLQGLTIGNLTINNSTLIGENSPSSGISLAGVSGTVTIAANPGSRVNGSITNGITLTDSTGTVNLSSWEIANNKQAQVFLENNSGTLNLTRSSLTANNAALVFAKNIGNLNIDNSPLIANNSPSNGITLDRVSGTATIAANPGSRINGSVNNGIALTNSGGTINLSGWEITGGKQALSFLNSTGTINISVLKIANPTQNAINGDEVSGTLALKFIDIANAGGHAFYLENATGTLNLTLENSRISQPGFDGARVDLKNTANVTATLSGNTIEGAGRSDLTSDGIDFEAIGSSRMTLNVTGNTIRNAANSGIELEVQGNGIFSGNINSNAIDKSGGDGVLFLHNSYLNSILSLTGNTITNSGVNGNGITKTPGPPPLNIGNGGFGIGVITVADGDLKLTIDSNTIVDSKDMKIGIAANPASLPLASMFAGTSRIDARVLGNTLSGTGTGLGFLLPIGSFGALADNGSTVCLQLDNNTADEMGLPPSVGYFLWNVNTAPPAPQSTFLVQSTLGNIGVVGSVIGVPPVPTLANYPAGICN